MSDHNSAVFNNACLKVPRDPVSQQPSPIYEQKYANQMENESRKLSLDAKNLNLKTKYSSPDSDRSVLKSLIEFYDSIPEYDDINHLSNKEFYRKLQNLKEKQRTFYNYIQEERKYNSKGTKWIDDYKNLNIREKKTRSNVRRSPKPAIKQFCGTPTLNKLTSNAFKNVEDVESIVSSDKEPLLKPPSRRSVRIESPSDKSDSADLQNLPIKSRANISSAGSKMYDKSSGSFNESPWDDLSINDFRSDSDRDLPLAIRSAPNSPTKTKSGVGWKDSITIPKPFKMTVRDEENKIVDEVMLNVQPPKEEKPEMFRANPIPIESRIPLFNKIVADQERRSEIVKQRSKEVLRSQMRPFSFTRREEEIQALTKRLSKSYPSIFLDDIPMKVKKFRAKPVPRGLFSNYVYEKMHEDEFYRALQRKIRAEEMLKRASLPPSMAKRERIKPKPIVCPRSYRNLELESELDTPIKSNPIPNYKVSHDRLEKELDDMKNDFITTSPSPFKFKTSKRNAERKLKRCYGSARNSSAGSRNAENYRASSAADLLSVNKSNLAAVLRIQSAKKKMEMDMCRRLEESKIREETRWREKILRKKPAWQALTYSHEEDLALRLQLRRDEERLRNEEHRHRMELMYGRVNKMPMLFERQSKYKHCPVTREELITKLHDDYNISTYCSRYSNSSPLSSSDVSRKALDIKDEDQDLLKEVLQANDEEKDKCDSP